MKSISIKKVSNKKDLKAFIRFNYELYKGHPYAVPDLLEDRMDTFSPKKNAAYEFCDASLFLAYRGHKVVGRVAAIINHKANKTWGNSNARFGWIDFIDDPEVSKALLDAVETWAKEHHANKVVGPLGFTDLDPEGMLIEGFDELGSINSIYNYPYYPEHLEKLGYEKEIDWVERTMNVPDKEHPAHTDKYFRVAKMSAERFHLRVKKFRNMKEIKEGNYAQRIFDVVNKAYAPLYGFAEITQAQIDQYVKSYFPLLDLRFVTTVENEAGEIIAMGVGMRSLSHAMQKAKGKLFPFGWYHLLKALYFKPSDIIELLLVAVLPEYQNKGVNALLFADMIPIAQQIGLRQAVVLPQLETNHKSQDQWAYLDASVHKRRRCFQKTLK